MDQGLWSRAMARKKLLPPTYFVAALAAMVVLHYLLPVVQIIPSPYHYLGVAPIVAGVLLNIWADRYFKRSQTTVKPFEESSHLIEAGPFRFSRHPMYLGLLLILAGAFILLGSLGPLVVVLAFVWLIATQFVQVEERMLEARFGDPYRRYQTRVRRWL